MSLRPYRDESVVELLAQDLSEQLILAAGEYKRLAGKLYDAGWRRQDDSDDSEGAGGGQGDLEVSSAQSPSPVGSGEDEPG